MQHTAAAVTHGQQAESVSPPEAKIPCTPFSEPAQATPCTQLPPCAAQPSQQPAAAPPHQQASVARPSQQPADTTLGAVGSVAGAGQGGLGQQQQLGHAASRAVGSAAGAGWGNQGQQQQAAMGSEATEAAAAEAARGAEGDWVQEAEDMLQVRQGLTVKALPVRCFPILLSCMWEKLCFVTGPHCQTKFSHWDVD